MKPYRGGLGIMERLGQNSPLPSMNRIAQDRRDALVEIEKLRELVVHCWIHSQYRECGLYNMTSDQKAFFNSIVCSADEQTALEKMVDGITPENRHPETRT